MSFERPVTGETMSERHARLLAAFSERAAALTAEIADRAMAAEDPAELADLARAFHAVGRSLRQAIALEQKLERAAAQAQREDRQADEARRQALTAQRRADLQRVASQALYSEHEYGDYQVASHGLERLLDEICHEPGFPEGDFQAQVRRLCDGARRWLAERLPGDEDLHEPDDLLDGWENGYARVPAAPREPDG